MLSEQCPVLRKRSKIRAGSRLVKPRDGTFTVAQASGQKGLASMTTEGVGRTGFGNAYVTIRLPSGELSPIAIFRQ